MHLRGFLLILGDKSSGLPVWLQFFFRYLSFSCLFSVSINIGRLLLVYILLYILSWPDNCRISLSLIYKVTEPTKHCWIISAVPSFNDHVSNLPKRGNQYHCLLSTMYGCHIIPWQWHFRSVDHNWLYLVEHEEYFKVGSSVNMLFSGRQMFKIKGVVFRPWSNAVLQLIYKLIGHRRHIVDKKTMRKPRIKRRKPHDHVNRPHRSVAQTLWCTSPISHNALFYNKNELPHTFLLQNEALCHNCLMHWEICLWMNRQMNKQY